MRAFLVALLLVTSCGKRHKQQDEPSPPAPPTQGSPTPLNHALSADYVNHCVPCHGGNGDEGKHLRGTKLSYDQYRQDVRVGIQPFMPAYPAAVYSEDAATSDYNVFVKEGP